jgi:hypothetical protein
MELSQALAVAVEVARVLEGLEVPFLIGGSVASSLHGVPRSTQDVDLVADLRSEHARGLVNGLAGAFYVDLERVESAIRRRASFNVIHLATMIKVDVFVLGAEPAARVEMGRRQLIELPVEPSVRLPVASPEDTIVQKLAWYRRGGEVSDRQWRDVGEVVKVQGGRLDREYMRKAAKALGVEDLLSRLLPPL